MKEDFAHYLFEFTVSKAYNRGYTFTSNSERALFRFFRDSTLRNDIINTNNEIISEASNSAEILLNSMIHNSQNKNFVLDYNIQEIRSLLKDICPLWPFC
ncbi:hypothetical protein [Chryseobacterium taichungense]|uniref:hypothetical protein n=1 Tax=Chryseobacterium taichungense TaxID=295069 RepID=UPI0028A77363|nr:hypothetical protein [Chryseobacterium taichungense]